MAQRLWTRQFRRSPLSELGWHDDRGNLTRFLSDPAVPPTNNLAEREIRPAVKARKVSQCSKTWRGARARECHLSITRTTQRKISGSLVEAMYLKYRAARTVARAASP
ncbi:transposase [Candidatus Poribacteria bacterium]|nr:transposase [Candidatus Poribacteria bacterium]